MSAAPTRPRIVYVCQFSPVPRNFGGALRFDAIWRALRSFADVHLVVLGDRPSRDARRVLRAEGAKVLPPRRETPFGRGLRILRAAAAGRSIPAAQFLSSRRVERFVRHVADQRPDLVVLGFEYLAVLIPALRPLGIPIALDAHNAASRGHARVAAASRSLATKLGYRLLAWNTRSMERRFFPLADQLWTVSREDASYYERWLGVRPEVVPNVVGFPDLDPGAEDEAGSVVFTGSYSYWPNEDAALRLMSMSDALAEEGTLRRLVLVGIAPTARMRAEAARRSHVDLTGAVPDVAPFLRRAALFAAPIAAGSGTKLKILEAFAHGRPVLTTPLGAEGLDLSAGVHAEVAKLDEFEGALRSLLRDPARRAALAAAGRAWAEQRFTFGAMRREIGARLEALLGRSVERDAT